MHYLILILLAPLFIFQAKRVKKNTPRLPEAKGERAGVTGNGEQLSVLIFGDSAAAGVGVSCQSQALSGVVAEALAKQYQVSWQLWAKSGYNTARALTMLQKKLDSKPRLRLDAAIVSLGVNDVLSPLSAKTWLKQQQALVELMSTDAQCKTLVLTRVPPMGEFPVLPQPLRWFLGKRSQEFNRQLERYVKTEARCVLLEFGQQLDGSAMASDGFHPGPLIYQDWGQTAAKVILQHTTTS
ncbi:SGNH/GDSL hydrolase family protein [Shewanella pneumatophori]|uniref:SGNH/GDSL hydrolase family protein n=1 Tax=Shewanella pneumatophori TaxID=314092 RepID=A0A9X1ZAE7_9GAMM|nr:SGNH/GDSL hydrolase family protein [Shewanella pneumatophori]MCL1138624.1 SGNH/GDSL hydrolase family protein [Shewanella pneumatophori]